MLKLGFTLLTLSVALASVAQQPKPTGINELKKLEKTDVVVGKGRVAQKGDLVYVLYNGTLKSGVQFDGNMLKSGSPYSFELGAGRVIRGWDEGIVGMRVGGKRKLAIPDELAYAAQPPTDSIPANADLYFEVELLEVIKRGEEAMYEKKDLKVGSGRTVKAGDLVEVTYKARLLNGRVFDDRSKPDQAVTFRLSNKKVKPDDKLPIAGIRVGLVGMKEGGTRELRLPPMIAFAERMPFGIPMGSFVIFEVTLRKVK